MPSKNLPALEIQPPSEMDLTQLLPEELLAEVLGRVAPRGLAACRCASKALRAVIDARRLLRADLLPRSVGGIFINFHCERRSEFFARPSTGPTISGSFDYLPPRWYRQICDHCNGLVLLEDCLSEYFVVNPATKQWDSLPPHPSKYDDADADFTCQNYLVFDPTVSPHYEVFVIPNPRCKDSRDAIDPVLEESQWPPSVCDLLVFSSRSGRWEERSFVRQGKAAGTVADIRRHFDSCTDRCHAVYRRDALYVHCKSDFLMRISLSSDKYQVIEPPTDFERNNYRQELHLGRSKKGLYFASLREFRLRVWVLEESCGHTNWVLKHNNYITPILDYDRPVLGPWVLQDINFNEMLRRYKERNEIDEDFEHLIEIKLELNSGKEELVEEKFEWDSENDNILHKEDMVHPLDIGYFDILGFHPYKEVVFLDVSMHRGLAYHLKDSKVQDLGYLYPTGCDLALPNERFITDSFPYTPCWTEHQ